MVRIRETDPQITELNSITKYGYALSYTFSSPLYALRINLQKILVYVILWNYTGSYDRDNIFKSKTALNLAL